MQCRNAYIERSVTLLLMTLMMLTSLAPITVGKAEEGETDHAEPFTWWMESRYELGWRLYDAETHSYPLNYIYPDGWDVGFDACESPIAAAEAVNSYAWQIEGVDAPFTAQIGPTSLCRIDRETDPAAPRLPAQGPYTVTLTVGFSDRESMTASQTITIRDLLIVAIGDSNPAGEGNPHVNQVGGLRPVNAKWFDSRCHRSANSGHSRAAAAIEANDPHTAVTFISFACSGAEIWTGLISGYSGIEPPGDAPPLKPQLVSVMEHLCRTTSNDPSCIENPREIDTLFLSIGVNDIGFSSILMSCAAKQKIKDVTVEDLWIPGVVDVLTGWDWDTIKDNPVDYLLGPLDEILLDILGWFFGMLGSNAFACEDDLDPIVDMNLSALWSHYDLLSEVLSGNAGQVAADLQSSELNYSWMAGSLRRHFVNYYGNLPDTMVESVVPREVYITSYPVDPFRDKNGAFGGCGIFEGITKSEAQWIYEQGVRLNQRIEWAATKHRWHYIDGIVEGFEGHGYCTGSDSYYVHLTDSLLQQSGYHGTLHPNSGGHSVTRDRLLERYYGDKPDWSIRHGVSVVVEAVRITDNRESPQGSATFTAKINDQWYRHDPTIKQVDVPVGQWVNMPENEFRYRADVANDDVITVLAHTTLGAGLFYPPKCYSPDCAQIIPSTRLRTERDYSLANDWGAAYEWCEDQGNFNSYSVKRVCTVSTSDADFSLDVRYRIVVTNLILAPPGGLIEPGDQVACGDFCQVNVGTVAGPSFTTLAEYIEHLGLAGEDASDLVALLEYLEENREPE